MALTDHVSEDETMVGKQDILGTISRVCEQSDDIQVVITGWRQSDQKTLYDVEITNNESGEDRKIYFGSSEYDRLEPCFRQVDSWLDNTEAWISQLRKPNPKNDAGKENV